MAGIRQNASGTKHPEFNMRDLVRVHVGDSEDWPPQQATSEFCCHFKDPEDPSRQKRYHYVADSNREAAEIVAKINHIMQMQSTVPQRWRFGGGTLGTTVGRL